MPPCSPHAGLILGQILALSIYSGHLQEWIAAAAGAGQRVSDEYLPRYLSYFERRNDLPEHFYDVLGKRGCWLARQNENWAYAVLPENDAEWELASLPARLHYSRRLRAADPSRGRALVESVWKSESAENRSRLIAAFEVNLNLSDEPFLEAALDDRANSVRSIAATLLARLDGSAYQQRMIERAKPLIRIGWKKQALGRKLMIDVALPEAVDESIIRDGIPSERPDGTKLEAGEYWLWAIAAKLSAAFWMSGDGSFGELVKAANDSSDARDLLLNALAQIAMREQNDELAAALLNLELDHETQRWAFKAASANTREAHALTLLANSSPKDESPLLLLRYLCEIKHRWSKTLTHALLIYARKLIEQNPRTGTTYSYAAYLPVYAVCMAPDALPELRTLEGDKKLDVHWAHALKQAVEILEFRRKMLEEFAR